MKMNNRTNFKGPRFLFKTPSGLAQRTAVWDEWFEAQPRLVHTYRDAFGRWHPDAARAHGWEELQSLKEEAESLVKKNFSVFALAARGRIRRILGEDGAEADLKEALRRDPSCQDAALWLAELCIKKNPNKALVLLSRVSIKPQARILYQAAALCRLQKWKTAVSMLQAVRSPWTAVLFGVALYKTGLYRDAVTQFDRAASLGFDAGALYRLRAIACHAQGDFEGLRFSVEEAFRRSPNTGFLCDIFNFFEGWSVRVDGLRPSAKTMALVDKGLHRSPRRSWALAWRADFISNPHFSMFDEAIEDLEKAAALDQRSAWIHAHLSRALGNAGRTQEALEALNKAAALDPRCGWIYAWRGALRLRMRREGALADLDKAVEIAPDYSLARAWRGQALRLAGRMEEARLEIELASRLEPSHIWTRAELCAVYQSLGLLKEAAREFAWVYEREDKHAQRSAPSAEGAQKLLADLRKEAGDNLGDAWVHAWMAWILLKQKKSSEVLKIFSKEMALEAGGFGCLVLAQAYEAEGDTQGAERWYKESIKGSRSPVLYGAFGLFLYKKSRLPEAIKNLSRAVELQGTQAPFLSALGAAYLEKNDPGNALKFLERALSMHADFTEALALKAACLRRMGKNSGAAKVLFKAQELQPECPWAQAVRMEFKKEPPAQELMKAGRHEDAVVVLKNYLRLNPGDPAGLQSLAQAYFCLGRSKESLAAQDQLVEVRPKASVFLARGGLRRRLGNFRGALKDAQRLLRARSSRERIDACELRAETLRNLGRTYEALEEIKKAIRARPRSSWNYVVRAKIHRQAGRLSEALADIECALKLSPEDAKAKAWQGEILFKNENFKEAETALSQALAREPQFGWALFLRGETRIRLGDKESGLKDILQAAQMDMHCSGSFDILGAEPASIRADRAYAWLYAWRGAVTRAEKDLNHALKLDPRCFWALAWRGELRSAQGNFKAALADLNASLEIFGRYKQAIIWCGKVLAEMNEPRAALEAFKKALRMDPRDPWAQAGKVFCEAILS